MLELPKDMPSKRKPENIAKALIEFQFNCPSIEKDQEVTVKTRTGHQYTFRFSSYGEVRKTIKPHMYAAKLGYTFTTEDNKFICRLLHESGDSHDTSVEMPRLKESMQENGSTLSFLKRYTLCLATGVDSESDDDANFAEGNKAEFKNQSPKKISSPDYIKEKKPTVTQKVDAYVVKVGKFASKKLSDIDSMDLQSYVTWLHANAKEKNQNLSGAWLEFAKYAEAYLTPDINTTVFE